MITRYSEHKLTWLDVLNPTPEEIHEIVNECGIPLVLATDLTSMTPRTEALCEKKTLKITLDFPIVKRTDINHPHEVKFIATKTHLVTIRFEDIEAVHRFAKEFEVLTMIKSTKSKANAGHLLCTLLNRMYKALDTKLDYLESKMVDIDEGIFAEKEKEMVFEISKLSRRLIVFRQTLNTHEAALAQLFTFVPVCFGKTATHQVQEIIHQFDHIQRRIKSLTVTLEDLRETNNSLLTTKQNEVMKTFTILAFITFPLTLFTSMFGMNTLTTPIVGTPNDFWIILSAMAVVSVAFFAYFRYKKWM